MSISEFFIKRPVFATVLNILVLVVGLLAYKNLGVREYPKVSRPVFVVEVYYSGAGPEIIEKEVTIPLEDVLGGLEGLESSSSNSSFGTSQVELHFRAGTDVAMTRSNISDALGRVRGNLPEDANEPFVKQSSADADSIFYLHLSGKGLTVAQLTHAARLYLKNPLKAIEGVSEVKVMGGSPMMTVELDQEKLLHHKIDAKKVLDALDKYNLALPSGRFQEAIPINIDQRIYSVSDLEDLPILKRGTAVVRLKDLAQIKEAETLDQITHVNGEPGALIGIVKTSEGNPLTISQAIHDNLDEYQQALPKGYDLAVSFDKTQFIQASLKAVQTSILEAIALVLLIVFMFLRNLRSSFIPLVTIPLSLVGVMSVMAYFGLSINTITLLAMVLAVGLVVDDAIVVLENIYRHIEAGLPALEAAKKGSREIGFAIIAMTLTLASVYAPLAFVQDTIGQVFKEFAITLAGAVIVSGFVALTFSPVMSAKLLRKQVREPMKFLQFFENWIQKLTVFYKGSLAKTLGYQKVMMGAFVTVFAACVWLLVDIPQAITPKEDRGIVGLSIQALDGSSLKEFSKYVVMAEKVLESIPEAPTSLTFAGKWGGVVVTALEPWSKRDRSAAEILYELRKKVKVIPVVPVYPWSWDTGIPGVAKVSADAADLKVHFKTVGDYQALDRFLSALQKACNESGKFSSANHTLNLNTPTLKTRVDLDKFAATGLELDQVSKVLSTMMDERRDHDFYKDNLRYSISIKGNFTPEYLEEIFAVNEDGKKIPLSDFMTLEKSTMPSNLTHFKQFRSADLNAMPNKGVSLDEAMEFIEDEITKLAPEGITYEYGGAAKALKKSSQMMLLLAFVALLFVYGILAIQFESFIDPLIIMFTVPLAVFGALVVVKVIGQKLDIFTQIGLVTLIGLITKHGILIVEFANQRLVSGVKDIKVAIQEAAATRLRPILMTTGAMVFGAIPLVLSSGAGAEARQAIGIVLVGGLLIGTFFTLYVIPSVYKLVKSRTL